MHPERPEHIARRSRSPPRPFFTSAMLRILPDRGPDARLCAWRLTQRELLACSKMRRRGNSDSPKQVLTPRRNQGDFAPVDTLAPDTIQKIVSAFSAHVSSDAFVIPADVTAQRLGPEPPDHSPCFVIVLKIPFLAMCGIPPALVCGKRNWDRHA